jgi:nitrite reductase/ring-hydroxylating ferredoxin subunit
LTVPRTPTTVDVGATSEFEHARPRIVAAGGRELGVIRWRDRFYAVRNVCPHMGARLCAGTVTASTSAEGPLDEVTADPDRPVVNCPWHGWTYDLKSGRALLDPEHFRVRSYPTRVASGRVLVEMS